MEYLPFLIGTWAFGAVVGYFIGCLRGRPGAGAVWGLLLGPLGWLIMIAAGDSRKKCPLCRGPLETLAVARCRHCGGDLRLSSMAGARAKNAVDPVEAWAEQEALKPENLRPLPKPKIHSQAALMPEGEASPMTPERRQSLKQRLGVDDD